MMKAIARGMNINLGGEVGTVGGKVSAGLSLDFAKILDEYSSEGDAFYDQKKIYFHKHVSDYLAEELVNIKNKHRLVIFIDDLDRCTHAGALEILESIKTFFDIEGLIYVIGMDPSTIDPIVDVKYGKNPKITGLDYLQKIVQLPVQIPVWSEEDLGRTIKEIADETELPRAITDKLSQQKMKDLIIKSAKLNPRNIKRFMNSLVLSYNTSDENLQDICNENLKKYIIENYLESMISIQTFYFRGEKWLQFLKMITDYYDRISFLEHFITFVISKKISYQDLRDKIKEFPSYNYYRSTRKNLEIYNKIVEIEDEDLFTFLQEASAPRLIMDKIENYLRAVDTKKDIDISKSIKITSYESINKLKDRIERFNEYVQGSVIHLPYLNLKQIFNSQELNLFRANLSEADLSGARLFGANLEGADSSTSILIQPQNYESIVLNEKTNFKNAICDKRDFIYHVSRFTEDIPTIVNNKRELRLKLKEIGLAVDIPMVESILKISDLPEAN